MRTAILLLVLAMPIAAHAQDTKPLGGVWSTVWMTAPAGQTWQGTGYPDPEPLKAIPNEQMLVVASRALSPDADRLHALVSIGRRHADGAVDVLAAALQPAEPDTVRETAIAALLEHGGPQAEAVLRRTLQHDPSPFVRGNSLWALCSWGESAGLHAVQMGLQDSDLYVQGMAVLAVRALPPERDVVLPILADALASDERQVWQEAMVMLADAGWPEAGEMLYAVASKATVNDDAKGQRAVSAYRAWLRAHPELR